MNIVCLMGNLTSDPEYGKKGETSYANFTVAVARRFKNADGNYDADFVRCVAFRGCADFIAEWFRKGQKIAITGEWRTSSYEDKNGNKRTENKCLVDSADFAGAKPSEKPVDLYDEFVPVNDADLPF